jgi:hypothetical protein
MLAHTGRGENEEARKSLLFLIKKNYIAISFFTVYQIALHEKHDCSNFVLFSFIISFYLAIAITRSKNFENERKRIIT